MPVLTGRVALVPTFTVARKARRQLLRLAAPIDHAANAINRRRPYPPLGMRLDTGGLASFESASATYVGHLIVLLGERFRTASILDVGCGCGSLPIVMAHLRGRHIGPYRGLDIDAEMVRWCDSHLGDDARVFSHYNYWNAAYNPSGHRHIPWPVASADVVVLKSVLTHMLPEDAYFYIAEVGRVLTAGGVALVSVFLATPDRAQAFAQKTETYWHFRHPPESAIALPPESLFAAVDRAGLSCEIITGVQDLLILRRLSETSSK